MPSEEEIADQRLLLRTNRRTLQHYLRQQDIVGESHLPPGSAHDLDVARANIRRIKRTLRSWGIDVDNHPDDEAPPPTAHTTRVPADPQSSTKQVAGDESFQFSNTGDVNITTSQKSHVGSILLVAVLLIILLLIVWYFGYISPIT